MSLASAVVVCLVLACPFPCSWRLIAGGHRLRTTTICRRHWRAHALRWSDSEEAFEIPYLLVSQSWTTY